MDVSLMLKLFPFFLEAAWITVVLSVLSVTLGLICGALGTYAKLSDVMLVRAIGNTYVSVFRGTPALVQLFILYLGGPQIGIQLDAFEAGVIGLGLNIGAYMTETMRGAILAIDNGQREASRTLGISRFQTMRYIILPQAARLMVRPLGVNIIAQIKATALVSAISVVELTYTAQRFIGSTYKPFEMFVMAGIIYIVLIYVTRLGINWLDRRVAIS